MQSNTVIRKTISAGTWITFMLIMCLFIPTRIFAADFTATSLGDHGNVTVMEVSGNYDADNPDGAVNTFPRQVIAKEFFKTHKDDYDFLVFFSNFDFTMLDDGKARGFYSTVKNDTHGLGIDQIDNTSFYGSISIDGGSGRLQGTIDMGNLSKLVSDPLDPKFEDTLGIFNHEMMHRWAAHAKFRDLSGNSSSALLGKDGSHWSFLLDSGGSLMYGNRWQDNGDGTFTSLMPQSEQKFYSPLDLYLMGMIDKSKVPPMLLIDSPGVDATQLPQAGVTITGTARTVTIDDIIAATTMGPRVPDAAASQKSFKTAFIFITRPGTFAGDDLYKIENIRNGSVTRFSILTDGNAIMQVASTPKEDVPVNPGVLPPSTTPRTGLPNINEGVQWLMAAQQADGSWMDLAQTMERDTAETTLVLRSFATATENYERALQWLGSTQSVNLDYLTRKIQALAGAGQNVAPLVQDILSRQNRDGGWGSGEAYESGNADTALVLLTLSATGYSDQAVLSKAINYLKSQQNIDGGWGSEDKGGMVQETSNVLSAFNKYRTTYQLNDAISLGTTWLIGKQNTDTDGGFGNSPSTVYDTAVATMALRELNVSTNVTNQALAYLLGQQSENGSWNNSAYQTALAVNAVYKATVDPDLVVTSDDITIIPGTITSLPSNIVINANINNLGQTSAQAKVILYKGSIADQNKLGEQTLSFPGLASTTVTFSAVAQDGSEHLFYIVVDPDSLVQETNELNNTAVKILSPEATYDLEVLPGDVTVAPGTADMLQEVKITARISNKGTMNAYNAHVRYFIDEPGNPFEIATQTVDVPAGSSITNEITWWANKAGENMPLVVQIDPYDTELSESNNKVTTTITVNADIRPNLAVSYEDMVITPNPGNERGTVTISALVKNNGFSSANNIAVRFYRGVPCSNTVLVGTIGNSCAQAIQIGTQQTITTLAPGENSRVSVDWADIPESGQKLIYVEAYAEAALSEISDKDNYAFVNTFTLRTLPDFAISTNSIVFSPAAPKEGDTVAITVTVQNKGEQTVSDVVVRLSEGSVAPGNQQTIPSVVGGGTATVLFSYNAAAKGAHTFTAVVDPENAVTEQSKDNNSASRTLGVQDSSLWVTEQYISPNGDGIKDSTDLFFRLEAAATVSIHIVNKKKETVRTFTGPELMNTTSGNIVWNGLNESGVVVDDGEYQLQVLDSTGSLLAMLQVAVDNNRSPLADAIGTKYLLNNNLTCMLPDIANWTWSSTESDIVFSITYPNQNVPEFPTGLYAMSAFGQDIQRITPNSTATHNYEINDYQLSPDGTTVAFIMRKSPRSVDIEDPPAEQLGIVDINGINGKILVSLNSPQVRILDARWSPDGELVVYRVWKPGDWKQNNWEELWLVNRDGIGDQIDVGASFDFNYLRWSPDGSSVAYVYGAYDENRNYTETARIYALAGSMKDLFTVNVDQLRKDINYLEWLGSQKILLGTYSWSTGALDLRLIDVQDGGGTTQIIETSTNYYLAINPKGASFALREEGDATKVKIFDEAGNATLVREWVDRTWAGWSELWDSHRITWSPDGQKLLFADLGFAQEAACPAYNPEIKLYEPHLLIYDVTTAKLTDSKIGEMGCSYSYECVYAGNSACYQDRGPAFSRIVGYFQDNSSVLLKDMGGYFVLNMASGTRSAYLPISGGWNSQTSLSPLGGFITYYQTREQTSACVDRGYYATLNDLWSLSSLLNLTTDLRIIKQKTALILKGTVADLNFEGYELEYADAKLPDVWNPVAPPSNVPVVNDTFTTWVPPSEGTFYVRLTVWDKAGNTVVSRKRVTWGQSGASITNLYKSLDQFSPNSGDPNKNTVELHYTIHESVHLEFSIYDDANNLVRSFYKDYARPTSDSVSWNGKDESGNVVPDGKYKIKVFDYEFFVEVDSTPPQVALSLSNIKKYDKTNMLFADLFGHAVDSNLKTWTIEYGVGDNPHEWYEYLKGTSQIAKMDEYGNPVNPAQDMTIRTFVEDDFRFLVGEKLRITAEDFAGNRVSAVTDFLEARIILDRYVGITGSTVILPATASDPSKVMLPSIFNGLGSYGNHTVGGLATVRNPLVSMNAQYRIGTAWIDGSPMVNVPEAGMIRVEWSNSGEQVNAVRIKAVDNQGYEYYSNVLQTASTFYIDECKKGLAVNSLFEQLLSLKVQVQSDQDTRYAQWTDIAVYTAPAVPTGGVGYDLDWLLGSSYSLKMIGTDSDGKVHVSESVTIPAAAGKCMDTDNTPPKLIDILLQSTESACNSMSTMVEILAARSESNAVLKTLSYFIQKPEGFQLLRRIDLSQEAWGGVIVDTATMPEGSYPVKMVLSFIDLRDKTLKEETISGTLVVDHVLPTARITYPEVSAMFCPVKNTDAKGDWYGLPIEGIATDNNSVRYYELYYGVGENPAIWLPAMTRINGKSMTIKEAKTVQGQLGVWDVTDLRGTTYSLKLKVVDVAGNASCYTTRVSLDTQTEITNLTIDKKMISPIVGGNVNVGYQIDEYATVAVKVFNLIQKADGSYDLDADPIRTITATKEHFGGSDSTEWDGKTDGRTAASEDKYGIAVSATDTCGNTAKKWVAVEVDTTPPTLAMSSPAAESTLGSLIVEVKGTADDPHFQSYSLERAQEEVNRSEWIPVSSGTLLVKDSVLGTWNTSDEPAATGRWTLRLTATDLVGNKSEVKVPVTLVAPAALIKKYEVTPGLISPNSDGKFETTDIKYELGDAADIKIEVADSTNTVKHTHIDTKPSAGTYTYNYGGQSDSGGVLLDGVYMVSLIATSSTSSQREAITITVDTTLPLVDMTPPKDNSFLAVTDLAVIGTVSDANMAEYSLSYAGAAGSALVDQGGQSRTGYTFGSLNAISEGDYTLTVWARDLGENEVNKTTTFTIDRTPPVVKLDTPKEGEYYGGTSSTLSSQPSASITIAGSLVEKNLDTFSLRYGLGDAPSQWIDLVTGTTVTALPPSFAWSIGQSAGIPDGLYTVSLFAKDKAGLTSEQKVKVTLDNTVPASAITSLHDGDYIKQAVEVKGTAYDLNFDKYVVEISEGQCGSAFKWAVIKTGTAAVQDNVLTTWQALPPDGDYCMRVTTTDKVGLTSEATVNVKVDTHPPAAPVLSGQVENKTGAQLDWTSNREPDIAGYNLYKAGQKLNSAPTASMTYLDQNLTGGVYAYTVKAVDLAGNESGASNEVALKIDLTGPDARIRSPHDEGTVSGLIDIKGTVYSADDFKQYRVSIGQGASPSSWTVIRTSPLPISYGVLAQWDTFGLGEGQVYSIKLEAEDLSGNITTNQVGVTIDNTAPDAPGLISAVTVPNSTDIALTWLPNTETDLAGYLLYRNNQLANVSGIVVGDLKPYLISAATTTYLDKSLPDGMYTYYLTAMDQAGNISPTSVSKEVTIETRAPHAAIVDPLGNAVFEKKTMVKAESPDLDIASVQFQYQSILSSPTTTTDWIDLGSLVTTTPFITYLDPSTLGPGFTHGDYRLRAVGTDKAQHTDPAPEFITITYTDLTPPAAPSGLGVLVNGDTTNLIWTPNTDADSDLAGYNVYRTAEGIRVMLNAELVAAVPLPTYPDSGLADGNYDYDVTAVDIHGNESKPSGQASAKVYAPSITQPYTPVGQSAIQVHGANAAANSAVSIFGDTGSGLVSLGTATADAAGVFTADAALAPGENRITARTTDSAGNISKDSDVVIVIYNDTPGAPTGLTAPVQGHDVHLAWDQNPETDILGYNLYRDGVKVNRADSVSPVDVIASSSFDPYNNDPWTAMDYDQQSYWTPQNGASADYPAWWEMDLAALELIRHLKIHWGADTDSSGNEVVYAGKDFEIQVWSADANAWITQAKVVGNAVKNNVFDFTPAYRTDKIRIFITDSTDVNSAKQVRLAEVNILKDNVVQTAPPSYDDWNLPDKQYGYTVTAVDNYGFEGPASEMESADVGDIVPPSAPVLTATVLNSDVTLNWTISPETDTASYTIYRNIGQGWVKIGTTSFPLTTYLNAYLLNGVYSYRVAAVDAVGNESPMSNMETATVYVAPPDKPINLTITPMPEGGLNAVWVYDGIAAGYNLYRSMTSGGPYSKVKNALISETTYLDTGLVNGSSYFYVVTASDVAGNESVYSDEDSGIPADTVAPSKPRITAPTVPGPALTVAVAKTDVGGISDPATTVELFRNGVSAGTTATNPGLVQASFALDPAMEGPSLSPDGLMMAYQAAGSIWLQDLASLTVSEIIPGGDSPLWSPDGTRIAYRYSDSNWHYRIGIFDRVTGNSAPLTDDLSVDEYTPSWTSNGAKIAFRSDRNGVLGIWIKDMATGEVTQVVQSDYLSEQRISPDGNKLAYFENGSLFMRDLTTGELALVDDNTDWYSIGWDQNSERAAFVSYRTGEARIYTVDFTTGNQAAIADIAGEAYWPVWSSDGRNIIFAAWDTENSADSIWSAPASGNGQAQLIEHGLTGLYYLTATNNGGVACVNLEWDADWNRVAANLKRMTSGGTFEFRNVALDQGQNVFAARAVDSAGNVSELSDEIAVVFDAHELPDLSVSSESVYLYPTAPIAGERMSINAVISNAGQGDAVDVNADLYVWNALGQLELLKSERIPLIAAGSAALLTAEWDSTGMVGENRIVIVVDPDDRIGESTESNNMAIKDFYVADHVGMSMTTALDGPQYGSSQSANISVTIRNTGPAANGVLDVRIEDANGHLVSLFDSKTVNLAYAKEITQNYAWNTGSTYAGTYVVHSILKDAAGTMLAENTTPFTIISDAAAGLTVVTDKIAYGPQENVVTGLTIRNTGKNYIIPILQATVSITDASGTVLFNEIKTASNLLPGASVDLSSLWNTGLIVPGDYRAIVQVSFDGGVTVTKSAAFRINTVVLLSGAITAAPSVVPLGNTAQVTYTLANAGNTEALGYTARISILDPETQNVMQTHEELVDIVQNSSTSGQVIVSTNGYGLKTYAAVLQAISPAGTKTIASASFTVKDLTPPVVTILSPAEGNSSSSTVSILTSVTDNASGVDQVEYRRDSGTWSLLPVSDPARGRFGATWDPTMADNGMHSVSFRATDKAGNASEPVTVGYEVQINRAPTTPSLAAPADGADVGTSLPELMVNNASDPNNDPLTYTFEVYADSDLTVKITSAEGIAEGTGTTSWQAPLELTENAWYYWRAKAFDGKLYGEWMSTAAFRVNAIEDPPSAPVPTSPDDGMEVATRTPILTVINAVDPDSTSLTYNFEVALDSEFTQTVTSALGVSAGQGTTSWQVPVQLEEDVWYYWRAQADDWVIQGDWSTPAVRFFVNTGNNAPTVPVVIAPADGGEVATLSPDMVLQNSIDADSEVITYSIELDTVRTFDSPNLRRVTGLPQGAGTTAWHVDGLLDNTGYFVRAKASDGAAESEWSGVTGFFVNTRNDAPTKPVPANPSDGAGVNVFTPTLSVQNATDLDRDILTYDFAVYEDAALSMPAASVTGVVEMPGTTSWTVSVALKENRTYYWQAQAYDGELPSGWTAPLSFTVNTGDDEPAAPEIVSPAEGSSVDSAMPTLTVLNAMDPDSILLTYEFQVFYESAMIWSATGVAEGTGRTSATLSVPLADNTVYFWRCRANDGNRDGAWTAMTKFTVHLPQTGITVDIEVEPETLSQKSKGNWVMVEIELPHGYHASDVDLSSIRLEGTVPAVAWPHEKKKKRHEHGCEHDHERHEHSELKVKFRRSDVIAVLPSGNRVPVHVTGTVGGTLFEGVDIIRVIH